MKVQALADRTEAATVLGRLKDTRAIDPLITALREFGADGRAAVVSTLQSITDQQFGADPESWQAWRGSISQTL